MRTPPRANPAAVHAAVRFLPRQNASFPTAIRASLEGCGAAAVAFFDAAFDVFDEAARAVVSGPQRAGVVEAAGRGERLVAQGVVVAPHHLRSEEHTYELQSLMHNSYAV